MTEPLRIEQLRHVAALRSNELSEAKQAFATAWGALVAAIERHPALVPYQRGYVFLHPSSQQELKVAYVDCRGGQPVAHCYDRTLGGTWSARPRARLTLIIDEKIAP